MNAALFIIDKYSCFGDKKPSLFRGLSFNFSALVTNYRFCIFAKKEYWIVQNVIAPAGVKMVL